MKKIKDLVKKENLIDFSAISLTIKVLAIALIIFLPPDAEIMGMNTAILNRAVPFLLPTSEIRVKLFSLSSKRSIIKRFISNKKKKDEEKISDNYNQGKLILDPTVAPSDISYPTDLDLLNKTRIVIETIIDYLYKQLKSKLYSKPKTYRKIAKKIIYL